MLVLWIQNCSSWYHLLAYHLWSTRLSYYMSLRSLLNLYKPIRCLHHVYDLLRLLLVHPLYRTNLTIVALYHLYLAISLELILVNCDIKLFSLVMSPGEFSQIIMSVMLIVYHLLLLRGDERLILRLN